MDIEPFSNNGHKQIDVNSDPYLDFDGVFRGAVEALGAQILFDPFEQKVDLQAFHSLQL